MRFTVAATQRIPDDARKQGLRASYSNTATAEKDKQVVALFVMNDAGVADKAPATPGAHDRRA